MESEHASRTNLRALPHRQSATEATRHFVIPTEATRPPRHPDRSDAKWRDLLFTPLLFPSLTDTLPFREQPAETCQFNVLNSVHLN
jgi:hypothetical protein